MIVERVLDRTPCTDLADHESRGGGVGLGAARAVEPEVVVQTIVDAGLRGRGGAGFPTGVKWRTVVEHATSASPTPVIVNAAEGEPGSFKDRQLLRTNPYKVLEGALIAAHAVGAVEVIVALKASFGREIDRLAAAIAELAAAGWLRTDTGSIAVSLALGPKHYLFGEETALLEVVEGRPPFPRVAPPFRRGLDDHQDGGEQGSAADIEMATDDGRGGASPALVNNVETFANVPGIIANGPEWFRELGTPESPGTLVCTVVGRTRRHAVGEVAMGTTLADAIEMIGEGTDGTAVGAVSGISNAFVSAARFDTPLTYEGMEAIGSGLGAGGFIVFDDQTDMAAVAAGASRFLAIESCGQCTPCKGDWLALAHDLAEISDGAGTAETLVALETRLDTVTDGARCFLAHQQPLVVRSIMEHFPEAFAVDAERPPTRPPHDDVALLPIDDLVEGRAVLAEDEWSKHPDWSYGGTDSGRWPAETLTQVDVSSPATSPPQVDGEAETGSPTGSPTSSPTVGADRFEAIRNTHTMLTRGLVSAARATTATDQREELDRLRDRLCRHLSLTRRVLYPMVRRASGAAGDDATYAADRYGDEALALLDRTRDQLDPDQLEMIRRDIAGLVQTDLDLVIPLLQASLRPDSLDALEAALHEAELTTDQPAG